MPQAVVDAGAVLDERDRERRGEGAERGDAGVEGARGKALLAGARRQWPVGARTFFVVIGLVAVGLASMLVLRARSARREAEAQKRADPAARERVERHVPPLKLAPPAPAPVAVPLPPPLGVPTVPTDPSGPEATSPDVELLKRRLARGFGAAGTEGSGLQEASAPAAHGLAPPPQDGPPAHGKSGALEEKLEAVKRKGALAAVLPDRDYLISQGAMLDCVLETRIVSHVAGMTSCHLTRDVYSTTGRVVLLDRGSRVVGQYQGGLQQGDARIFVLWTRVETPEGVVVDLESPGTGPLGEAGLGGHLDTRFWDRFGAAILMSVIEGAADAAAARAAGPARGTNINVGNTASAGKEVVARSMEPTINIPPTLAKNQGERVGILVARDLDFRGVYALERAERTE